MIKNTFNFAKVCSASFLIAGIVLLIASAEQRGYAQEIRKLSQGGAQMIVYDNLRPDTVQEMYLHAAPPELVSSVTTTGASVQIILGMLLILIGFCIHALLVMRVERTVPVHEVQRDKSREVGSTVRKALEVYWVELRK